MYLLSLLIIDQLFWISINTLDLHNILVIDIKITLIGIVMPQIPGVPLTTSQPAEYLCVAYRETHT